MSNGRHRILQEKLRLTKRKTRFECGHHIIVLIFNNGKEKTNNVCVDGIVGWWN